MDLELVETSELIAELERRFDHLIVAGLKDHDDSKFLTSAIWKGNAFACAGLAQAIGMSAINEWIGKAEEKDEDDL